MELIIGVDCATRPSHVGLACAERDGTRVRVREVVLGADVPDMAGHVAAWIAESGRALLSLDSPLGWPTALGDALAAHRAGQPVGKAPDRLFRRETDRSIRERLGKQPLDVGADRIARTAAAALDLLAGIGAALARREILASIAAEVDVGAVEERAVGSDHLLDSVVCVLAGKDFLEGRCVGPAERSVAEREGWIWAARGG